jgi:hypothetical protein
MTTVTERLYDNAWYLANANDAARAQLEADQTRAWMDREDAVETASRARTVASIAPSRSALAHSLGAVAQASYDRARARVARAASCTDIVHGHAFALTRRPGSSGAATIEVASCTLRRRATLSLSGDGGVWTAMLVDPQSRTAERMTVALTADARESLLWVCSWVVSGRLGSSTRG